MQTQGPELILDYTGVVHSLKLHDIKDGFSGMYDERFRSNKIRDFNMLFVLFIT